MKFSPVDYSVTPIKEFRIHGSRKCTEQERSPQVFAATIFEKDSVKAKSAFFRMLDKQYKIKATKGVILRVEEIKEEENFELKNYAINFVYRTKAGLSNGYKEIRHISKVLAIADLYQEFGSSHKVKSYSINISSIKEIADDEVTKVKILSYTGRDVSFPVFKKVSNTKKEYVSVNTEIFN
ncbi:large subunit ribosomal protein L18Ae [Enteropsectra breve]|nr:large subunit ribosomal protein L18Ae [Enteropsectra breve]